MTLGTFVRKFRVVKRSGAQYLAQCPAHDDQTPSLSIGEGDHGQVLIHCHAGCDPNDVLRALGLTMHDLLPGDFLKRVRQAGAPARPMPISTRPGDTSGTASQCYDYRDETGKLLYQVVRLQAPKGFRQRRPKADGGWEWAMGDVRRVVYRLPELTGKDTIFITEGEKDADNLAAHGFAATTNSGGAKKWTEAHTGQLVAAGVKNVVIFPDNDGPGREHAATVASSCRAAGLAVKVVTLPDVAVHGDVSDYLASHSRADLLDLIRATPAETAAGTAAPTAADAPGDGDPVLTRLSDVEPEEIDWIWRGRIARGKFTQLAGNPGEGKSRLTFEIASHITTGAAWPDGGVAPQGNVLFVLAEDGIADTVRPAVDAMGGDSSRIYLLEGIRAGESVRAFDLARGLDVLEQAIEKVQPQLVVVDPITAFLGKTDSYKDAEVRGLLAPILALIARHRTALVAVAHLSKDTQKSALYRPGGSIAFVAAARFGFIVGVHPEQPGVRVIARTKNNIGQPAPSLAYRIQQPNGHITWDGEVAMDAETLLAPRKGRGRPRYEEAFDFVQSLLENGPMDSAQVYELAAARGHSKPTTRRAITEMGIEARKIGGRGNGKWVLALPGDHDDHLQDVTTKPARNGTALPVQMALRTGSDGSAADNQDADVLVEDQGDRCASDEGDEWES